MAEIYDVIIAGAGPGGATVAYFLGEAEQLDLTLSGNALTFKGEVEAETEFEGATYLRRERRAATFTRSLTLPVAVEADRAQASLHDGVLTLTLPKSESVRPKTIKVTAA